jgi:hypothetical protein
MIQVFFLYHSFVARNFRNKTPKAKVLYNKEGQLAVACYGKLGEGFGWLVAGLFLLFPLVA